MASNKIITWTIVAGLFVLLSSAFYLIVSPFLEGFAWALILVLITWPLLNLLKRRCRLSDHLASLTLTLSLTALSLAILVPAAVELGKEIYAISGDRTITAEDLVKSLTRVPIVGNFLEAQQFRDILRSFLERIFEISVKFAGQASQVVFTSLFNIGVMLLSSYFLYRNGKKLMNNLEAIVTFHGGPKWLRFFELIEKTIKGVVYGALLTALVQGFLAGIGFYVAGAPMPVIFALATVLISFVPFGAPMIYVPVSFYLIFVLGSSLAGFGLLIYGIVIVSTSDNIIRPLFISQAIQVSLLLVFVGVVGGIFAFGLIGLFIGPVIIAIAQVLWKELVVVSAEMPLVLKETG